MLSGSLGAMAPPQVSVDGSQVFVVGLHPTNTSAVYAHDTATGNVLYVLPGVDCFLRRAYQQLVHHPLAVEDRGHDGNVSAAVQR